MDPETATREEIRKEALRLEEDSLYSAKGHWEAARPWERRNLWIGIPLAIASAGAGVSALGDLTLLATGLAFFVAAGTAVMTLLSPQQRHQRHLDAGGAYKALNNEARIFRTIECARPVPVDELVKRLRELDERRNQLNAASPGIPRGAFERARSGIEAGEAKYLADRPRDT